MKVLILEVALLDYWHAGAGTGKGPSADAQAVKSQAGLPYLPGRTLRGLLREAVQLAEESALEVVPPGTTQRLFGAGPLDPKRGESGVLRVSNAELPPEIETWAASEAGGHARGSPASTLFHLVASTAIEEGVAKDKSLRVTEVALPVILRAHVHGPATGDWQAPIRAALPLIRGLGSSRRRGLGRVQVRAMEKS